MDQDWRVAIKARARGWSKTGTGTFGLVAMSDAFVVAVTATFERADSLKRLIDSFANAGQELGGFVVVDNSPSASSSAVAKSSQFELVYCHPGQNLGCGAGLRLGMEKASERFSDRITHFLLLDDDAELSPGALTRLL